MSILGDDSGIIQETLRAKGVSIIHTLSSNVLNDTNTTDHHREVLEVQSPHLLIVAKLPVVPTPYDKKGRKRVRHLVTLVRQQMARGKHVILLDSPRSQTWEVSELELLSQDQNLTSLMARWCSFGIQDDQTKLNPSNITQLLTSLQFSTPLDTC